MSAALAQNIELLRQGVDLLQRLNDDTYGVVSTKHETSYRVGPHLRHCVDAYRCLLAGLEGNEVDYDGPSHDRDIEADRQAGLAALEELIAALGMLETADPGTDLRVRIDTPSRATEAEVASCSTLYRELQFLVGHTAHHYALIAMILRQRGFDPGRDFGVAPSTPRHWEQEETPRA